MILNQAPSKSIRLYSQAFAWLDDDIAFDIRSRTAAVIIQIQKCLLVLLYQNHFAKLLKLTVL